MAPRRRLVLFAALILTLVAAFTVDRDTAPPAARREARRVDSLPAPPAAVVESTVADFRRRQYAPASGDLFAARSWRPAPPAITDDEPGGPPALPFTYLGKLREGKETVVFLRYQERTLAVRRADVIDGTYRVEQITPQSLLLLYLPLKERQTLDFGSTH